MKSFRNIFRSSCSENCGNLLEKLPWWRSLSAIKCFLWNFLEFLRIGLLFLPHHGSISCKGFVCPGRGSDGMIVPYLGYVFRILSKIYGGAFCEKITAKSHRLFSQKISIIGIWQLLNTSMDEISIFKARRSSFRRDRRYLIKRYAVSC